MYKDCVLLPELIQINFPIYTEEAENLLYDIFKKEIYDPIWYYQNKPVYIRKSPKYHDKEEAFFHIISNKNIHGQSYYTIDLDRAQRLLWGKAMIENEPCLNNCCKGLYVWSYTHNSKNGPRTRRKIYHPKYWYLVILEEHRDKWKYITSYKVTSSQGRRKLISEYKKQRTLNHNDTRS